MYYKLSNKITYCIVLAIFYLISCENDNSLQSFLKKAKRSEEVGNYQGAMVQLNKALALDSSKSLIYVARGIINRYLNNDSLSLIDFSKAISLDETNTSAYYQKGISLSLLGKDDSAIHYYNYALRTKEVGDFYFEKNSELKSEVNQHFDKNIPIEAIRYQRGISFYEIKKDSSALSDFYFVLKYKYNIAICNFYIGAILITQGDSDGCKYLTEAVNQGESKAQKFLSEFCR